MGMNMIQSHYMHVRKSHTETHYFVQLIYTNKKCNKKQNDNQYKRKKNEQLT
jgi:hypothetical protein